MMQKKILSIAIELALAQFVSTPVVAADTTEDCIEVFFILRQYFTSTNQNIRF